MNFKRMFTTIFVFILIILSIQIFAVEEYDIDNVDRSKIFEKVFFEWMDTFKSEDVSEEKRIMGYDLYAYSISESNVDRIKIQFEFNVTPVSQNTVWENRNMCFLEMTNVNGEYKVDYISEFPRNYDKFLEKFEEYKLTAQFKEVKDNRAQGQQTMASVPEQKIEQISNILIIACAIVLALVIIVIIIRFLKMKSTKHEINNI